MIGVSAKSGSFQIQIYGAKRQGYIAPKHKLFRNCRGYWKLFPGEVGMGAENKEQKWISPFLLVDRMLNVNVFLAKGGGGLLAVFRLDKREAIARGGVSF